MVCLHHGARLRDQHGEAEWIYQLVSHSSLTPTSDDAAHASAGEAAGSG